MRLVGTPAWIECLSETPHGDRVGAERPRRADWLVPTIVQASAIVCAAAQAHGPDILTCDRRFEDLLGVCFIPRHDA